MAELNITNIPAPRVPFVDERTGLMAREWYRFFLNLFVLTGSGNNPITLEELQLGPPNQPDLAELLIQINQNIAPQYEDQSGDFLATLDTAQLMSMMSRFENAEAAIQGAYLQPVVQTGTIANYNLDSSPTAGGIVYGTGPALAVSAAGTLGQVLTSAGAGTPTWAAAATGTVTSVAQSFTGGLISVAGSPITTSGTLALTVAGTSGGIPYFSSATTWATSALLTNNAIMLGGGAAATPKTTTTGTGVVTALGVNTGTAGAFVVNGGALGTPASGTVTNLTGTASININGTVGATTANTGAFTTLSATGITTVAAGSAALPAIVSTTGTADTGLWFPAADTIAFSTAASERMRLDSSGSLGLKVTPSGSSAGAFTQLQIGGASGYSTFFGQSNDYACGLASGAYFNSSSQYVYASSTKAVSSMYLYNGSTTIQYAAAGTAGNTFTPTTIGVFSSTGLAVTGTLSATGVVTFSNYGVGTATFNGSGVISSVSDETWKVKDGAPVDTDVMINKLEPGYWYYNDEKKDTFGADRQLGFYAQNVNAAIGPEAAPEPEEGKPWGYYDRSVLAVTVMSLQKALATIESLTARITALENK